MRKFWYRRILIMILVLSVSVGGSYCLLQLQQSNLEREVAAEPSETMVIPGGMPVGIYLETDELPAHVSPHLYLLPPLFQAP